MARYDVVVIGAGLGGLTAAAILARAGRKVLVIERSNSVGGAASSYKSGDLFIEGSLQETSDPRDVRDPKHAVLTRAGVLDAVKWIPAGSLYEVRGGPLEQPFVLPDNFAAARGALTDRFPEARAGIAQVLEEMESVASGQSGDDTALSLSQKFDAVFGDNEAVKCALAANLSYFHDDPASLSWGYFARAQGSYLLSGGRFVEGGSQRLSSALARAVRVAGGEVMLRRVATGIALDPHGRTSAVTHTAKDGSHAQTAECARIIGGAAPGALAPLMPKTAAENLTRGHAGLTPSISLFALTLGLSKPPREFGVSAYSTQLLADDMKRLADYGRGTTLMAQEPGMRMPPMSVVDYAAIDAGIPGPPHVLSVYGPDLLSNWDSSDMDAYREKRGRWQAAIVRRLDQIYPGLAGAVVASSFNSALSVRQYLNAPHGAVYGFAPTPGAAARSPRTAVPGLYLASAYAGFGGYTGVVQSGGACAGMILHEGD
jgi:phytoene dehydrogenase-like protein